MRIGDLSKRVDIQAPSYASDSAGGQVVTWVTLASSIPCALWPVSAVESIKTMGMILTISHRVKMRYRANMKASYRLKFGNRYFNIVSIINAGEQNRWLDLLVKEAA